MAALLSSHIMIEAQGLDSRPITLGQAECLLSLLYINQ
jgi:hypothetical protein